MKKKYYSPEIEITKLCFEEILDKTLDTSGGEIGHDGGDPVGPDE